MPARRPPPIGPRIRSASCSATCGPAPPCCGPCWTRIPRWRCRRSRTSWPRCSAPTTARWTSTGSVTSSPRTSTSPTGRSPSPTCWRRWPGIHRVINRADAVAGMYTTYAARHGKGQYADKTPSHLLYVPTLAARFPSSTFVHIVRDGRDVAASLVTMEFGAGDFAEAAPGLAPQGAAGARGRPGARTGPVPRGPLRGPGARSRGHVPRDLRLPRARLLAGDARVPRARRRAARRAAPHRARAGHPPAADTARCATGAWT